jgi:hypothetical protein
MPPVANATSKLFCRLRIQLSHHSRWSMTLWITNPLALMLSNGNLLFNRRLIFTPRWLAYTTKTPDSCRPLSLLREVSVILTRIPSRAPWKPYFHQVMQLEVEGPQQLPKVWKVKFTWRVLRSNQILLRVNQEFSRTLKIMNNRGVVKWNTKTNSFLRILRNPSRSSAKST